MVMNIIMVATMLPTMLLLCILWRNFDSRQNGYTFGIQLNKELEDSDFVKNQQILYRKRNTQLSILIFLMVPIPFFIEHVSIQFTFWMAWLLLGILIINYPCVLANKAVKAYKHEAISVIQPEMLSIAQPYNPRSQYTEAKDEEDHWYWGMLYYNPNDRRSFVNKRFGTGTTMNMASKGGKLCGVITFLALAWIPIICGWLIAEDFTPMHLKMQEDAIVCTHVKDDYVIPLAEITDLQLLETLPNDRTKRNGTGTDTIEKGKWVCRDYGLMYEFLNPKNKQFLLIQTADRAYLICGYDDNETIEIYKHIK